MCTPTQVFVRAKIPHKKQIMSKQDAIVQVKAWITPSLVAILMWFGKNAYDENKDWQKETTAKIDALVETKTTVAVNVNKLTSIESRLDKIDAFIAQIRTYAKPEDEINLDNLKKQSK